MLKITKNLKKFKRLYNGAPEFSFETIDKKKYVEEESSGTAIDFPPEKKKKEHELSPEQYAKEMENAELVAEQKKLKKSALNMFLYGTDPQSDPKFQMMQKELVEQYKKKNFGLLDEEEEEEDELKMEEDDDSEPELEEIERFTREKQRRIPEFLTKTSLQDRLQGRIMEELFNSYEIMDNRSSLDVTKWQFGPSNFQQLAELKKMNDTLYDNKLNSVKVENSKTFQTAKLLERDINFYSNDIVSTIQFYKEIKKLNFMDQDKYSKYRALFNSVVEFLNKIQNTKDAETYLSFTVETEKKHVEIAKSELEILMENLSNEYNIEKVQEKETKPIQVEKPQEQLEFEYFINKFDSESFNPEELNFYLIRKTFGTKDKKEIQTKLTMILSDLIEMFEKYEILIFNVELLEEAKKFVNQQEEILIKLNKLIEDNKREIHTRENPYILPKYLHTPTKKIYKKHFE